MILIISIVEVNSKCKYRELTRIKSDFISGPGQINIFRIHCYVFYIDVFCSDVSCIRSCIDRFLYFFLQREVKDINVFTACCAQIIRDL